MTADAAVLSRWLGRRVTLRPATAVEGTPVYESPDDDEERTGRWHRWEGASIAFHDIHANVLLDGAEEDALPGTRAGSAAPC